MPKAHANGMDIEYEVMGDAAAAPLLLIAGLGQQLIAWEDEFCAELAGRGFRVIRHVSGDDRTEGYQEFRWTGERLICGTQEWFCLPEEESAETI